MSKRRDLERHLHSLGEIKNIMNAMKNLALMETHKLARVLPTQHRVVTDIEAAARDFVAFHPHLADVDESANEICLLLGSERGFCGDFNQTVVQAAESHSPTAPRIVVGSRLADRLADDARVVMRIDGPSVLEEVELVLLKVMETLDTWQSAQPQPRSLRPTVFYHQPDVDTVKVSSLHPSGSKPIEPAVTGFPPHLYLDPHEFIVQLTEHYLFAALCVSFYDSLMAENQRRMHHMEYAVQRIEQDSEKLLLQRNSLRQEEITEEIELIMLNLRDAAV
jgi:F-type H+-transporting ATPase subunit gamma